jgi:rare lipoprotein A (peptidoglycan hydrolase)
VKPIGYPWLEALVATAVILAGAYVAVTWTVPAHGASCIGQTVTASWYGTESGNRTANGERFDGTSLTAAHKTLPFGTKLRVTYRGKSVVVRINDRGPFIRGRALDLSKAAAQRIGLIPAGVGSVCMERL